MPKFQVNKEQLKGPQPVPAGVYDVRFEGFKPAQSKNKDSVNYNPQLIIASGQFAKQNLFSSMNSKLPNMMQDMVHAFGLEMVLVPGTTEDYTIPGMFDGPDDDPTKWVYKGPLLGKIAKVEVIQTTYNNKPKNDIKQFICNVPGCAQKYPDIRHNPNWGSK